MLCKKKVFLEISLNSQENTCARVSFLTNNKPPARYNKSRAYNKRFSYMLFLFLANK